MKNVDLRIFLDIKKHWREIRKTVKNVKGFTLISDYNWDIFTIELSRRLFDKIESTSNNEKATDLTLPGDRKKDQQRFPIYLKL